MVPIFGDITGPVFARFPPDTMREGDLYWYSDCYASRGAVSHSNDQVFLAPVFHNGARAAFVMGWAHFSDIGGLRPGSISSDATEIFHEGIIIPPTRLIDAGTTNEAALEIFYRNSRYPETCRGDARALMASVDLGVRRIGEILQAEPDGTMLRVSVEGGGCSGFQYKFDMERAKAEDDLVIAYTKYFNRRGGVISWDGPIQVNGLMDEAFRPQIEALGELFAGPRRSRGEAHAQLVLKITERLSAIERAPCAERDQQRLGARRIAAGSAGVVVDRRGA